MTQPVDDKKIDMNQRTRSAQLKQLFDEIDKRLNADHNKTLNKTRFRVLNFLDIPLPGNNEIPTPDK